MALDKYYTYYYWKSFEKANTDENSIVQDAQDNLKTLIWAQKTGNQAKIFENILNSIWSNGESVKIDNQVILSSQEIQQIQAKFQEAVKNEGLVNVEKYVRGEGGNLQGLTKKDIAPNKKRVQKDTINNLKDSLNAVIRAIDKGDLPRMAKEYNKINNLILKLEEEANKIQKEHGYAPLFNAKGKSNNLRKNLQEAFKLIQEAEYKPSTKELGDIAEIFVAVAATAGKNLADMTSQEIQENFVLGKNTASPINTNNNILPGGNSIFIDAKLFQEKVQTFNKATGKFTSPFYTIMGPSGKMQIQVREDVKSQITTDVSYELINQPNNLLNQVTNFFNASIKNYRQNASSISLLSGTRIQYLMALLSDDFNTLYMNYTATHPDYPKEGNFEESIQKTMKIASLVRGLSGARGQNLQGLIFQDYLILLQGNVWKVYSISDIFNKGNLDKLVSVSGLPSAFSIENTWVGNAGLSMEKAKIRNTGVYAALYNRKIDANLKITSL